MYMTERKKTRVETYVNCQRNDTALWQTASTPLETLLQRRLREMHVVMLMKSKDIDIMIRKYNQ